MTSTTFKTQKMIGGNWATFTCERGSSTITVEHPDLRTHTINYYPMWDNETLTTFAGGYSYGFERGYIRGRNDK